MDSILLISTSYLFGSIPFSVWLGKIFLGLDVRQYGDGNPGATNVFKAGNSLLGIIVLLLDITKAALPVGYCYYNLNIRGTPMIMIALAPILGHIYTPFLNFKGGKALATALGVWIGLTIWKASLPAVLGVVIGVAVLTTTGWAVMIAMGGILIVLLIWPPDPLVFWVWAGETVLLAWTHRTDLVHLPRIRPWIHKLIHKIGGANPHG